MTMGLLERRRLLVVPAVASVVSLLVIAPRVTPACVHLDVNSSIEPAKVAALEDIARDYNRADRRVGDRCVEIAIYGTSSGDAEQGLHDGWEDSDVVDGPRPQVWLPTSSMWLERLRATGGVDGDGADDLPAESEAVSITQSLLVVALPEPLAEALRDDDGEVSWQDIEDLVDQGWGSRDHDEWGPFLFGKDDPRRSTSGLAATVAAFYAASGLLSDLRPEDVRNPEYVRQVQRIEAGVHHYAPEIVEFLKRLDRVDPKPENPSDYISAVVLQEQLVYEYNRGVYDPDGKRPSLPLVPVYPTDGTLRLDHPYVVLRASPAQRAAAEDFRDYLLGSGPQDRLAEAGFRHRDAPDRAWALDPDVAEVMHGDVEVDDGWLATPPRGDALQEILATWDQLRKPARVLLLLDTSGSMKGERYATMQRSVDAALDRLPGSHQVGLWTFPGVGRVAHVSRVEIGELDNTRDDITSALGNIRPAGHTPLFTSIRDAYDLMVDLGQAGTGTTNAIVVLSDGVDHDPVDDFDKEDLLAHVREVEAQHPGEPPVRIFSIAFTTEGDFDTMQEISRSTDVDAYNAEDTTSLEKVFVEVTTNF